MIVVYWDKNGSKLYATNFSRVCYLFKFLYFLTSNRIKNEEKKHDKKQARTKQWYDFSRYMVETALKPHIKCLCKYFDTQKSLFCIFPEI